MKLSVGHKEIVSGLVMYLASRGVTGFNPDQVHAEFSFKRGTKELVCDLDEDAPAVTQAVPVADLKPTPKPKAEAPTTASTVAPVEAVTETAAPVDEAVAAEVAPVEAAAEAPAGTEENLFG